MRRSWAFRGASVRIRGEKTQDLLPEKDDPILKEVCALRERVYELEDRLEKIAGRLSRDEDAATAATKQEFGSAEHEGAADAAGTAAREDSNEKS